MTRMSPYYAWGIDIQHRKIQIYSVLEQGREPLRQLACGLHRGSTTGVSFVKSNKIIRRCGPPVHSVRLYYMRFELMVGIEVIFRVVWTHLNPRRNEA